MLTQTRDPYSEPNAWRRFNLATGIQMHDLFYGIAKQWQDGEHALMAAILSDILNTLRDCHDSPKSSRQRRFREAERWIMTLDEDDWVFSFDSVCSALKFDPGAVRAVLVRKYGLIRVFKLAAVPVVVLEPADPHASHIGYHRGCPGCSERAIQRQIAWRARQKAGRQIRAMRAL